MQDSKFVMIVSVHKYNVLDFVFESIPPPSLSWSTVFISQFILGFELQALEISFKHND